MKKLASLLVLLALAAACNQASEEGLEAKKNTLAEKQKELASLQDEISQLKNEIEGQDTTQKAQKLTPVTTQSLKPQTFTHFVKVTGTITSQENVMLSAETSGRVTAIPAKEGQQVKAGDVLVKLNSEALKNQLDEAQASYKLAKTTYERRKRLWNDSIGSEIEYLNAETNFQAAQNRLGQVRARYDNAFISSPINGKVDEINVNVGEFLGMGTPVVRVVDMNNLEVEAELSEQYLGDVQTGDSVLVEIPALDLEQLQPVTFSGQYINPDNRSFKIKVNLNNDSQLLKPNLLANLKVRDYQSNQALVVPSMAINQDLQGEFVYVLQQQNGKQLAEKRYVEKGRSFEDQTEVLSGLSKGDQVVTAGYNEVSDGEAVRVK